MLDKKKWMAKAHRHIEKSNHNKKFGQAINDPNDEFGDWKITVYFYTIVHLIEAVLCKEEIAVGKHDERMAEMVAHPGLFNKDVRDNYTNLSSLCHKARYKTEVTISPRECTAASQYCEVIEENLNPYIS